MGGALPGSQFLDRFLYIGHVRLGEKWVGGLGDFKWDASCKTAFTKRLIAAEVFRL